MAKTKVNNHSHIMFRYLLIILGILLFSFLITRQLFCTTVLHADNWNAKADSLLPTNLTILPERGDILAADGSVLVTNLCFYNIHMDFGSEGFNSKLFVQSVDSMAICLAQLSDRFDKEGWKTELMRQYNKEKRPRYYKLLDKITHAQLTELRSFPFFRQKNKNKSGMIEVPYMKRSWPYGSMARRSIGRVGQTKECNEVHGISGLEKALDGLLYGEPGMSRAVTMTRGIRKWTDVPAKNGYNVTTTIDITLQDLLEQELNTILDSCGAEWGCAVLMEVATGDIKAISNLEYDKSSGRYIEAYNRAVVAYEPGSVVKPISMMFALEKGYCPPLNQKITTGGSFKYAGGRPISDSHFTAALTPAEVIEHSSNVGMAKITIRGYDNNPEGFVKNFEEIGFFEKMNSGIAEEETPRMNRHPKRIDMSRMCFGYTTAIPPLYTLSVYNAIANGGRYVRPRLVKGISREGFDSIYPVTYIRERICSEENAEILRDMLTNVVEGSHGTGRRLKNNLVRIAGKTGTCYHIDTVTHRYDTSKKRLAFCGFFPADKPKYSCMVLTFHPTKNMFGAPSTSGEVLKNMALKMYSRGMLDNFSDYTAEQPAEKGTLRISASAKSRDALKAALGANISPLPYRTDALAEGHRSDTVPPSVRQLGIRDALVKLENAGYDVKFSGTGRVVGQALVPGTKIVALKLK